jgi:PAS domain S-box-containing protein
MEEEIHILDSQAAEHLRRLRLGNQALDAYAIVAITDSRGVIRSANANFCAISGYSEEELLGRTHKLVNSGHHPPEFFRAMWECIRSGNSWRGNICNRAKDGRSYWVDTMILPQVDPAGKVIEYLAVRKEIQPPTAPEPGHASAVSTAAPASTSPAIGREGLERRMLDNRALRDKVLGMFLERTPGIVEAAIQAVRDRSDDACDILHGLKGTCLNIEAVEAASMSQKLEDLCHAGRWDQANALVPSLESLVRRACEEAEAIRGS